MKKALVTLAVCACLSSGLAVAQNSNGQTNSGYDMKTLRNIPLISEGPLAFTPFNRHSLTENHLTGIQRGRMCALETRKLLSRLSKANFADAQRVFTPTVRPLVTPARLEQMWTSLSSSYGTPTKSYGRGVLIDSPPGGYSVIAMTMDYPKASLTAHVMCDVSNNLTDFKVTEDDKVASN